MPAEIFIAIFLGIISVILILSNPYFGLILFTLLLYLRPADLFPFLTPLHIVRIVGGITFLVLLFKKGDSREPILKNCSQVKLLSFLILIMVFSGITSIWRSNSLGYFINFLKIYIGFLLVINLIDSLERFKGIIWTMVLSGLYLGITAVIHYFQGEYLQAGYRVASFTTGMFGGPNELALCLIMLIPFLYFLFIQSKVIFLKLFLIGAMVIVLMGITFTYSRGGTIGMMAVLLLLFLRSRYKLKLAIGFVVVSFLFFNFAPVKYIERMKTVPTSYTEDAATISRIDAWKAGISMMTHRPFGVGMGNFGEGFVKYRPEGAIDVPGRRRAAHNAFIQIGGETGILGLLVFLSLIAVTLRNLNRIKYFFMNKESEEAEEISQFADAVFISLIGFSTCAFFLSQAYNWILYYLFGFSIVLKKIGEEYVKKTA